MILTRTAILTEIESGRIRIDPFTPDQVGAASIDLHLGDEIRVLRSGPDAIDIHDDVDYLTETDLQPLDRPYVLVPGETVLGITRESIALPGDIAGWLEGRSRFARLGLMIHVTAGFVSPGVQNRQVLEISNVSRRGLAIHPGTRLCQIVLQRCDGSAVYAGRFAAQMKL